MLIGRGYRKWPHAGIFEPARIKARGLRITATLPVFLVANLSQNRWFVAGLDEIIPIIGLGSH